MANTINVNVATPGVWIEGIAGPTSGIANVAGGAQYCNHTGAPAETLIGHRFTGDTVPFTLLAGESLYVNADTNTTLIITES